MATPKKPQRPEGVELREVPLSEFQRWERNPKGHDIGLLIVSLRTYGLVRPPAVNPSLGKLIYGHGLTEALERMMEAGEDPPRRVRINGDGQWMIPTNFVDLEEPLHEPYLIIDNRATELGGWDFDILPSILQDLASQDLLDVTGFDGDDLDAMIKWNSQEAFPGHKEVDESIADSVERGTCPSCGIEFPIGHARKLWLDKQNAPPSDE